jgi:hypothetical protein
MLLVSPNRKTEKNMKTTFSMLVLALLCWVNNTWAQVTSAGLLAPTNAPVVVAPSAATPEPGEPAPEPASPPLIARPGPDRISVSFDSEFPLLAAVTNLADQASIKFVLAPELMTNGVPIEALNRPVGVVRYENVTARQALDTLLSQNNLVIGRREGFPGTIVAPKDSNVVPLPVEGNDLAEGEMDSPELQSFFDPNKEVPLITAIQMLGRLAKLNILVDPRLKTGFTRQVGTNMVEVPAVATNTVSLSAYGGVTPRQTLDAVLNNYGLVLLQDPKTGFAQVTYKDPSAKEPVYTYVVQLRYANTTNIMTLVQSTFPSSKVQGDLRTAQLVLLSTQKEYDAITNLVAQLDTPTKQVLIEARFLETFTNPKSIKGIDWTDTLAAQRFQMGNGALEGSKTRETETTTPGTPVTTTLPSGRTVTTTPPSDTKTTTTKTTTETLSSGLVSLTSSGGFSPNMAFLNAEGVSAVLSFLNTESDSRVLATPRAVTLDNQETRLQVTRAIPIFDASEGIGQGGTAVSSTKPNYTNVGTILIVTPRITGTNVAMKVSPEISRVEPIPSRKVVAGKVNEADIFATSRIETQVMVPSGNTLVMGGLISDTTQKGYTKVPFLGDIPGLGWAFRRESKENSKANLIVFLTPTIIEGDDFQPYRTEFLNTPMPEHGAGVDDKPWNRGKPWDWKNDPDKDKKFDDATRR